MLEGLRLLGTAGYRLRDAPECCTPAMLYPREGAKIVTDLLSKVECRIGFGKDLALHQLKREHSWPALWIQPSLVQHIGLHSSLSQRLVDPLIV